MTKNANDSPDFERPALQRMRTKWWLVDALMGGTEAMQAAGEKVLQRERDEEPDEYQRRIKRTVLTNFYKGTIGTHSGMPFNKPVEFDPPLPERLAYLHRDADGSGRSISTVARDLLREAMHHGLVHVMVDLPSGEAESYADTLRRQPRVVQIDAGDLLDVAESVAPNGEYLVDYARVRQTGTEGEGAYGSKDVEFILEIAARKAAGDGIVLRHDHIQGEWVQTQESPYTLDWIPLFTLYANQTGAFEGEPAYKELAELNLAHYQSDADQRHGLSYGRRATVVQTGVRAVTDPTAAATGKQDGGKVVLGYGRKITHTNEAAKVYLLETSGAPLAAGQADLTALEERMERFGATQVSKGGGITATSRMLDNQRDTCNLEAWCTRLENVLLHVVRAIAELLAVQLPANQTVMVSRQFSEDGPQDADTAALQGLATAGLLRPVTLYRELQSRGVLSTTIDPEAEAQALAAEKENNVLGGLDRLVGAVP